MPLLNGEPATGLSLSDEDTVNIETAFAPASAVASNLPFGLKASDAGLDPVANGLPATEVSVPLATENIETLLSMRLETASNRPSGLNLTDDGPDPVVNRELAIGVSAPDDETEKTETESSPAFALASSLPAGLNASETGCVPVTNGDPGAGTKTGWAAAEEVPSSDAPTAKTSPTTNRPSCPQTTPPSYVAARASPRAGGRQGPL
jgi:hypothetical protein